MIHNKNKFSLRTEFKCFVILIKWIKEQIKQLWLWIIQNWNIEWFQPIKLDFGLYVFHNTTCIY